MDWVNRCNTESKYIGDYLVRLKTTDVRYVAGSDKYSEGKPEEVPVLSPSISYIKKVSSEIVSEPGEGADVYIGFFDIIPQEEQGDPLFFPKEKKKFFMITNGYASKMEDTAEALSQRIRFGINLSEAEATQCAWFNPETGEKEPLEAVQTEENITYFEVELWGGSGALFVLS